MRCLCASRQHIHNASTYTTAAQQPPADIPSHERAPSPLVPVHAYHRKTTKTRAQHVHTRENTTKTCPKVCVCAHQGAQSGAMSWGGNNKEQNTPDRRGKMCSFLFLFMVVTVDHSSCQSYANIIPPHDLMQLFDHTQCQQCTNSSPICPVCVCVCRCVRFCECITSISPTQIIPPFHTTTSPPPTSKTKTHPP